MAYKDNSLNVAVLLMLVTLTSVAAQTFQYSRGWTNGKRSPRDELMLERILSPCQMSKLKLLLEGKGGERLFTPCDYPEEDVEAPSKSYKHERSQEPLFDTFQ